jgi:hypothetical protein
MECELKNPSIIILDYDQLQKLFEEHPDVRSLQINIDDTLKHDLCRKAAKKGHLSILKWARENGCPWDEDTCSFAAEKGHLEVLQWAHANGCPWDEDTCSFAAANGHLSILQWVRKNGCPWDKWTCTRAASGGHLEVLQWAHTNGCPWDEWTCDWAVQKGHLSILQWARENGCPWDKYTCENAAKRNNLYIFQWAVENGCPWDIKAVQKYIVPKLLTENSFSFSHFILDLFQKSKENNEHIQQQTIQLQHLIQQINENMNCLNVILCKDLCTTIKNYL